MSAKIERELTSRRASVRRSMPIVSRTNQWSRCAASAASAASTWAASPAVLEDPAAERELVGAQQQDRVVELARHRERPPRRAGGLDRRHRRCRRLRGRAHRDRRRAQCAVEAHVDVLVVVSPRRRSCARAAAARTPRARLRAVGQRGERLRALADRRGERLRLSRVRRSAAIPARALRERPRSACRTRRRGRGARGACRRRASARRCRAAHRAAALRAGSPPSCGRRPAGSRRRRAPARSRRRRWCRCRPRRTGGRSSPRRPRCRCGSRW